MTGQEQLRQLKAQRDAELRKASFLFAHVKRDSRRALSPDRFIRRHLGVSLVAAAVLGLLIAPAPRYQRPQRQRRLGKLLAYAARHLPGLAPWIKPGPTEAQVAAKADTAKPAKSKSLWAALLLDVLPIVTARVDWSAFFNTLKQRMVGSKGPAPEGHEPMVAVANVGTKLAGEPIDSLDGHLGATP